MKFLLDQCLPRSTVDVLRDLGHTCVHCGDCGLSRALDEDILQYARKREYVVVTLDADFHHLLAITGASGPSVIRIREQGMTSIPLAKLIDEIAEKVEARLAEGGMISASEDYIRLHALPVDV